MHHFFWLAIVLAVAVIAFFSFVLGHRTAERKYEGLRRRLVEMYEDRISGLKHGIGILVRSEGVALDRLKAILGDVSRGAEENESLARHFEAHWQPGSFIRHREKAMALREILSRHGGM